MRAIAIFCVLYIAWLVASPSRTACPCGDGCKCGPECNCVSD